MNTKTLLAMLIAFVLVVAACGNDLETATVTGDAAEDAVEEAPAEDDAMEETVEDDTVEEDSMEEETPAEDDAMEDDVMVDRPTRIVSLSPTATEMLFAIGAGEQVIAVDSYSYYPDEAPVTDLVGFEPNVEAIAGFEPDLVISSAPVEGLEALGIENMVQFAAASMDDVYAQIEQIGAVTGHVGEAAELVGQMQTDIDAVLASLPEREAPLTYYHELDNTLYSVTSATFIGEVYSMLGLQNVADAADPDGEFFGYPQLNEEFLVTADPDMIFLADTICCAQTAATVAERPGWDQLRAVQNGKVVELNDDIVSRWGPRLVEFITVAGDAVASFDTVNAG